MTNFHIVAGVLVFGACVLALAIAAVVRAIWFVEQMLAHTARAVVLIAKHHEALLELLASGALKGPQGEQGPPGPTAWTSGPGVRKEPS